MKIRFVAIIALLIAVGPIGWGLVGRQIFCALIYAGAPFDLASLGVLVWITFPFFFWCVWVLTNMDAWDRILSRIMGIDPPNTNPVKQIEERAS